MNLGVALAIKVFAASAAASTAAEPQHKLDMVSFFSGRTHAENVMKVAMKRPSRLVVDSIGGKGDRGDFVLIDTVREEGKPIRTRKWVMRQSGPNRYTGTLSDAVGPVDVAIDGPQATIRYTMKGGLKVDQSLTLEGDGRTLSNRVVVKKFGLKFARVEGKIRKLD
jgi:Protein of unknown function (DUF3833)